MVCGCTKTTQALKGALIKGSHVVHGFTSLGVEKTLGKEFLKYARTDERINICRTCEFNDWSNDNKRLWCRVCGCFVPAKARVADEKCPKGKW